jgi:hypothetical protein
LPSLSYVLLLPLTLVVLLLFAPACPEPGSHVHPRQGDQSAEPQWPAYVSQGRDCRASRI